MSTRKKCQKCNKQAVYGDPATKNFCKPCKNKIVNRRTKSTEDE